MNLVLQHQNETVEEIYTNFSMKVRGLLLSPVGDDDKDDDDDDHSLDDDDESDIIEILATGPCDDVLAGSFY